MRCPECGSPTYAVEGGRLLRTVNAVRRRRCCSRCRFRFTTYETRCERPVSMSEVQRAAWRRRRERAAGRPR